MATKELNLYLDVENQKLVTSFDSTRPYRLPKFVLGDSLPVNCRVIKPSSKASRPWDDVDPTSLSIRLGIGNPETEPTAGTWTITYDGDETSALDFDATAAEVDTALNALASITSAGGVTVTKATGGAYRITFDTVGARTAFSTDNAGLYPTSDSLVGVAIEGDASTREVVLIKLESQPAAYVELTTALDSAGASVSTVREGSGTVSEIQQYTLTPTPYDGSYTIDVDGEETTAIAYDATAATIQSALEALAGIGSGNVTVQGTFPTFTVNFALSLGDVGQLTVDATGLTVPVGRKGTLDLNTTGIIDLLNGGTTAQATFEIEVYDTGTSTAYTALQESVTVKGDVIGNNPSSQTPLQTYVTPTSTTFVGTTAQSLTETQKNQAMDNLSQWEVKSASFTAEKQAAYVAVATLTVTDPTTPVEGKGFRVLVRNGTATVGGTAYANAGTIIDRIYHSGSYANYVSKADAATSKTTPVDADAVEINDSAASGIRKTLSWANLKATLKTYFDTLYVALTGNQTIAGNKTFSGTTTANTLSSSGATITGGNVAASTVDIDGATDIGAALADADLILVDDGASGTNRKSALSRFWTYILGKINTEDLDFTGAVTSADQDTSVATSIVNVGMGDARFGRKQTVYKTVTTNRNTTTTFAADPDLTFSTLSTGAYIVRMKVSTYDNSNGGFKWQFTSTGAISFYGTAVGSNITNPTTVGNFGTPITGESVAPWPNSTRHLHIQFMLNVISAGTLTFEWAQNTSSATNTPVSAGSWIEISPLP